MSYTPPQVLFGAAYYHEYQPAQQTLRADFDGMKAAGFTVIRVGESVWSTWEPADGVFDLEWLTPVLDMASEDGIGVVLGTPTYAVPPWLQRRDPEINADLGTGRSHRWGMRQEIDVTHAACQFHAERVVRKILERHANHPSIIGFQVDNEPGAWGLTYWSHKLSDWSDLWLPDGNSLPQCDLAWRTFQGERLTEDKARHTGIVNEFAGDRFVMTCMSYSRPTVRDDAIGEMMTVTAALALAHAALRSRDVLGWCVAAQPESRPHLPGDRRHRCRSR